MLTEGPSPVTPSNITGKFRDAFEAYTANQRWREYVAPGDIRFLDGNALAASYLVLSKDPLTAGSETWIETTSRFHMPIESALGAHMSQRTLGQEFAVEVVSDDGQIPDVPDLEIVSITQSGTTLTVTTAQSHQLSIGKSIGIRSVTDSRVNYPALVLASVSAPNQFTCTAGPGGTIPSVTAYTVAVLAATTAALPTATYNNGTAGVGATLTATVNGAFPALDGVAIPLNGRVLVKNQAAPAENGVYTLTTVGSAGAPWMLTRAVDFDTAAEMTVVANALYAVTVYVAGGATQALRQFYLNATVTTVGTTAVGFTDSGVVGPLGYVYFRERLGRSKNGVSQIFENGTATNSSLYIRSEAGDALPSGTAGGSHATTVGSTASVQLANSPYTYAFAPTSEFRINAQADRTQWYDSGVDAVTQTASRLLRTQVCPDPTHDYKFRIRCTTNKSLTVPNAQVISWAKAGASTTATVVTDRPHGYIVGELVVGYGARDQAASSFPNLLTATPVLSVVDATTFTITCGTAPAGLTVSYGGYFARVNGGNLMSSLGANATVVQSATVTTLFDGTRQLTLVGNASWGGLSIGDMVNAVGLRDAATGVSLAVDGAWKVANIVTATLTLIAPTPELAEIVPLDFPTTNCGGAIIKRTCFRLSFVRIFDYERQRVEFLARPSGDLSAAAPVAVQGGSVAISGTAAVSMATQTPIIAAGTNAIGTVAPSVPPTAYFLNSAATTNGNLIITGTSGLQTIYGTNTGAGAAYVKLYNKATAPTVGTDVPEMILPIPAAAGGVPGVMPAIDCGFIGHRFPLGLGIAITGGAADTDTTAVAAGQVKVKLSRTI